MSGSAPRTPMLARFVELVRCGVECASAEVRKRVGGRKAPAEPAEPDVVATQGCGCGDCGCEQAAPTTSVSDVEFRETKEV